MISQVRFEMLFLNVIVRFLMIGMICLAKRKWRKSNPRKSETIFQYVPRNSQFTAPKDGR